MDKVSVIIPAYNVETYIYRAIESVLSQTYKNVELVIVDDGSSDNTWDIIQEYTLSHPAIKAIHQENQGVSTARNTGLDTITGKYVVFLDSDDWIEKHTIQFLMDLLKDNQNFLISCDRYFAYFNDKGEIYKERQIEESNISIVTKIEAIHNIGTGKYNLQSACYKLFDRECIKQLRFNTEIFHGEDGLFIFEYLNRCSGLVYSTEPLWNVLERPGSATSSPYNKKWLTAITAAELIYTEGKKNIEIIGPISSYLLDRIEMVENAALRSVSKNNDNVKYIRKKLREKRNLLKRINYKAKIKYTIYAYVPIFLLRRIVLAMRKIKNG